MRRSSIVSFILAFALESSAQTPYKVPPKEVVDILDSPPTPSVVVSPRRDAMLLVDYRPHPSIALLARPILRLGGLRIDPQSHAQQRTIKYTAITVKWFDNNKSVKIALPSKTAIGFPSWSYDGKKIAFARDAENGVELWIADPSTGKASVLRGFFLTDILDASFQWMGDNTSLLVHIIPKGRGKAPEAPGIPIGPIIDEASGKVSRMATFQDLLKNPTDENLFEYYATSQLAVVNSKTGAVKEIGFAR